MSVFADADAVAAFLLGEIQRPVRMIENLITGERHTLEWGGVRLRIDQDQDPALLFRCIA